MAYLHLLIVLVHFNYSFGEKRFLVQDQANLSSIVTHLSEQVASLQFAQTEAKAIIDHLQMVLQAVTEELNVTKTELHAITDTGTATSAQGSGSTYVKWGKSSCSGGNAELVYSGYAAGSNWNDDGAAVNYLCLVQDPDLVGNSSLNQGARIYGAEYLTDNSNWVETSQTMFGSDITFQDVPCAVCHIPRSSVLLVPGKRTCHSGWTEEYRGYLSAGYYGHKAGSEFVCIDDDPDIVSGGDTKNLGKLFYLTEAICGSLKCPPYENGRELTCVVCSK